MEEVRFEDYDGKERNTSRFFHSEKEREELPFLAKAAIGVAAGAGLLAIGHRTGAMRKIGQYLNVEAKSTIQAAKETLDSQGQLFRGQDKLTASRMKKLKESFVDKRKELISERKVVQKDILSSRKMRMEHELERRSRIIGGGKDGNYTGEVAYNIQEGYRHAAIMDDVRIKLPNAVEELDKALSKEDLGILNRVNGKQLKALLRKHGGAIDTDEVHSVLKEATEKYQGKEFSPKSDEAFRLIEGMQKKLKEATALQMQKATQKDNAFKSAVIGHKQATVQDILDLNAAGKIRVNNDLMAQIDDVMKKNNDFSKAIFDENLYLSTKNGELIDYKVFSDMKRSTAEWWSNTIPGGLVHLRDILNVKKAREEAGVKIFQRGSTLSGLNAHRGFETTEALDEEVVFMYGKFVRLNDVEAVNNDTALEILNPKRDMYLTSSQFGTSGKMHRHMSGIMTENDKERNLIAGALDVGRQDKDSVGTQFVSMFTKFNNKEWERNRIKDAINNGMSEPEDFFQMNTYFKLHTSGLSPRVMNNLTEMLPSNTKQMITDNNINFSREEDITKLFKLIGEEESKRSSSPHTDLKLLYRQFERDPDRVLNRKSPIGESNPILGHHTELKTGQDEINQQVGLYMMQEIMSSRASRTTANVLLDEADILRTQLKDIHHSGKIKRPEMEEAENLLNYSMFRAVGADILDNQYSATQRAGELFQTNSGFQESMRRMGRKTNPIWERFSETRPENLVGDEFIAINESNVGGIFNKMFGIDSSLKDRASAAGDLAKQLSPFTGRKNMEDVTTLSLYSTYYPMYRLQDALGNIGLGFSDASMGNAFQMFTNLMVKRIFPVYGGVEAAKYADWKVDQVTGEGLDERWENYKANARLDDAMTRTEFDIYQAQRERSLKPGIEHWEAMPEVHIPGIGPVSAGDALNLAIAPFMGSAPLREEDMMTYEETLDDLYNGTEEIRKSRFWFAGSKSAYRGDRISEFAPNSFRRAHSDYEWSGTEATGEEYWGNHILPTLENPLGGLSFALGMKDPYWYERKHYYDRPYMLTGELFNPNTMVLGDIGNATIGKLIKPVHEMHPEYWGDPTLIYDEETSKLGERPDSPIRTRISPAGRAENDVLATTSDYDGDGTWIAPIMTRDISDDAIRNIDEAAAKGESGARYFISNQLNDKGKETGAYVAKDMETEQVIYVPENIAKEDMSLPKLFQMAGEPAPEHANVKGVVLAQMGASYQAQVSTQPRAMMDEEYAYKQEIMYRKMANIRDPRDGSWRLQEGIENWTEPLGVYKWIMNDELLGRDPYGGQMVVQRADAAYNASNRFWESELGSLGSQMSEIGRRFIRRDDGQLDKYNPIRNTMPDWMPGDDYFINFQIGDPYTKIQHGERRLPGEAYESLNELHSDETGRYGAFDKFKILADVAPWSDEYKFWSQYMLDTLPDGDLRKEATQIRKQVSQRKQKYDFQEYRFKGNDIVQQDVTVSKFLDDYTFLTEELGDTPIRLAGMEYRKKAEGVLQGYFQEGDKVTIGIAENESERIAKDTYGTMRAVVYNKLGNINKDIIERGAMVENQNDYSAPGVHARYTQQELNRGSRWETLAHTSSPLNTKFLQVRTALEEYERDQVYGKDWATWQNFMLDDYIVPTVQGLGRFDSPLWSMAAGATTGLVLGRFFLKGGRTAKVAAVTGALFGLGSNAFYKNYEKKHGEAWIPERRRTENEINEYFDVLKYMKYEGLYQKAREEIVHSTGYDVEDFVNVIENQKELTKERRSELEDERKQLFLEQPDGWEDRRKEINAELETISENWNETYLPDAFLQALQYKEERDTTLYGIDPHDDRMKVMQAFPYKDKWFFSEFAAAGEDEREKILSLVPENQRRIYKALWGMETEDKKPLEYYMQKYDIPDWNWEGWKPEYDLEDVKVKAVKEAGLNLTEFNYWDDDVQASQYVPNLQGNNNAYRGEQPNNFAGFNALRQNISNILQGQGLADVTVSVTPSNGNETDVNINYKEDRSKEIEEHLRMYGTRYV